jgi:hypothetical protein
MTVKNITAFTLGEILTASPQFSVDGIVVVEQQNDDGTAYYVAIEQIVEEEVEYIDYKGNLLKRKCLILKT